MRAIVIGGGIVGLCAGAALRRLGAEVLVCEREPEIRAVGASLGLWPNGMRVLDEIGAGTGVRAYGRAGVFNHVDPAGRQIAARDFAELVDRGYLTIHRARLNQLLADTLGAQNLSTGAPFTTFDEDENGVTAYFEDGRVEHADLLVGADGVYSRVRERLVPGAAARVEYGHLAWRAVLPSAAVGECDEALVIGRDRTRGGVLSTGEGLAFWAVAQFATAVKPGRGRKAEALARVRNLYDGKGRSPLRTAIEATPEDRILRNRIVTVPPLRNWVSGRVALAGDAAHAMSPHITSGASLGLEDVGLLADRLASSRSITHALRSYERNRLARYRAAATRVRAVADASHDPVEYTRRFIAFLRWMLED